MIAPVRPACASCRYFVRLVDDPGERYEPLCDFVDGPQPFDVTLQEFGKCVRQPPQLYGDTLNGEWPIVHEERFCGEYRQEAGT